MMIISPASNKRYYLSVAKEELLTEEIEGYWLGSGTDILNLRGNVRKHHFNRLFDGFNPFDKSKKLVFNAGHSDRQGGWDLVFLPPKSVSVLFSLLPQIEQEIILREHHNAVKKTLQSLSDHVMTRRYDKDNRARSEKAHLVVAAFTHYASRENDPLLHTHCCVINLCFRDDGSTGAIQSRQMFVLQKQYGALYRAELSKALEQKLGVALTRSGSAFEIAGIPSQVIDYFSKRRNEILAHVEVLGFNSWLAKRYANFETRAEKTYRSRVQLIGEWKEQGQALGLSDRYLKSLLYHEQKRDETQSIQTVVQEVSRRIKELNRPFFDRDVLLLVAEESQCRGIGLDLAQAITQAYLSSDDVKLVKRFQKSKQYEPASIELLPEQQQEQRREEEMVPTLRIVRGL